MVRLKDANNNQTSKHLWISIPYGAIKRTDCVFDIKKYLAFQFLMVRLKDVPLPEKITLFGDFNSLWCD